MVTYVTEHSIRNTYKPLSKQQSVQSVPPIGYLPRPAIKVRCAQAFKKPQTPPSSRQYATRQADP